MRASPDAAPASWPASLVAPAAPTPDPPVPSMAPAPPQFTLTLPPAPDTALPPVPVAPAEPEFSAPLPELPHATRIQTPPANQAERKGLMRVRAIVTASARSQLDQRTRAVLRIAERVLGDTHGLLDGYPQIAEAAVGWV